MRRDRAVRQADAAFIVMVIAVCWMRYAVLSNGGAPPTIDAGDWLAHGDAIFGIGIRSTTIVYPPLVPLLVEGAVGALGLTAGTSAIGALAAIAPAVGLYLALRMLRIGAVAIGPALLVLGAGSVGEAAAWGGFPQLIGLGIAPVLLVMIDRLLDDWEARRGLYAGFGLAALMATSHFVTAAVAVAAVVLFAVHPRSQRPPTLRQRAATATLFILPTLWLIPLYVSLFDAFGGVSRDFRFFNELTWAGLWDQIEFLYRDLAWLWRPLMVLAVAAPVVFISRRRSPLWRVTTATLVSILIIIAVTREGRYVYLLTPYAALGTALWMKEGPSLSRFTSRSSSIGAVALTIVVMAGFLQIDVGSRFFEPQRGFYGVLTPDLVDGIETVRDRTDPGTVLAVTSLNDAPFGRWVEAIADRKTFYGSPLRWLLFDVDIDQATFANALFVPPFPDADRIRVAAEAGVDLILVPTRWVFFDHEAISEFTTEFPGAVEYVTDELVVIDTAAVG